MWSLGFVDYMADRHLLWCPASLCRYFWYCDQLHYPCRLGHCCCWKTRWWKTCGLHLRHEKRNPGWGKPSQAGGQRVKQEGSGGDGRAAGARWILLPGEGNFSVMHRKAYFRTKGTYDLAMGPTPWQKDVLYINNTGKGEFHERKPTSGQLHIEICHLDVFDMEIP